MRHFLGSRKPGQGQTSMLLETLRQKTVHTTATMRGVGLHTGQPIDLTLRPAPPDTGIVFNRVDIDRGALIEARAENVIDMTRATTLGAGSIRIGTVEHLLSALRGLGVDNVYADVSGAELPAGDGSAAPFVELILRAGVRTQRQHKRIAVMRSPVEVREGDAYARLSPAPRFTIDCDIAFDHPTIGAQRLSVDFTSTSYQREIADARTFCFLREVEWLRSKGLARGGSFDNCIVVDERGVMNPGGLRRADEFVRHKVLDAVGDLALLGMSLIGKLECHKAGHALHHQLLRALRTEQGAYEVVRPRAERSLVSLGVFLPDWAPAQEPLAA